MRNLTIDNFESNNETIATGDQANQLVRRDKAFWDAYNYARKTKSE